MKNKQIKELFLYLIVGGLATIVEWGTFWLISNMLEIQYLLATAFAFILSTLANWGFGRILVFKERKFQPIIREIGSVYLASMVGLLFNLILMLVMVQFYGCGKMLSKIIATVVVFAYNYLVRKYLIYKA